MRSAARANKYYLMPAAIGRAYSRVWFNADAKVAEIEAIGFPEGESPYMPESMQA